MRKGRRVAVSSDIESPLWDDWHVVGEIDQLMRHGRIATRLFGIPIVIEHDDGIPRAQVESGGALPAHVKYGFVWTCLGTPSREIVDFPECADPERWVVTGGAIGVAVSGLRAVENFLDLGHLGFVHAGYLGEQPHNEIRKYKVAPLPEGGIVATECRVYQPLASPVATEGFDVDYSYEVIRPYTVLLYKANPVRPEISDMIVLFVQPVTEESCIANMLLVYLKDELSAAMLRQFAQLIFCQDKPILENQMPKKLPLSPRAEIPVRADASSAAYRQWLRDTGIRFGAIPAG
jgi:phenylpropionate dioxygenase-like ring-hydroxylating dioxygenase large terminal subunit